MRENILNCVDDSVSNWYRLQTSEGCASHSGPGRTVSMASMASTNFLMNSANLCEAVKFKKVCAAGKDETSLHYSSMHINTRILVFSVS